MSATPFILVPTKDPARRCWPVSLWPEADRLSWAAAIQPGDVLDPGGPASRWAPVTRAAVAQSYGRWLNWLDRAGQLDPARPPAGQVEPERVRDFIAALREVNAPKTVLSWIIKLTQAVGALAPGLEWAWLRKIVARLHSTAKPVRMKRLRLVGSDELFALGLQIMAEAEQGKNLPAWRRPVHYRDGLMIALMAARPLRLKNFTSIEIGRHLVVHGQQLRLQFARAETKNRQPLELPFPEQLRPALDRYLSYYRPMLEACHERQTTRRIAQVGARLWVSQTGSPLNGRSIYDRIVGLTRARLGRRINPHLFRDCAATSIAIEDPEHVQITLGVLGHTSLATSERSYNHAHALRAVQQYQAQVLALRRRDRDATSAAV